MLKIDFLTRLLGGAMSTVPLPERSKSVWILPMATSVTPPWSVGD